MIQVHQTFYGGRTLSMSNRKLLGYTQGVFDLLHIGHIKFIELASRHCDSLTVGVISDQLASSYKPLPVMNQAERMYVIENLKFVSRTLIVENKNPLWLAAQLNFDIFFWGEEWQSDENKLIEEHLNSQGVKVVWIPRHTNILSSRLRDII
jgi:glycerol-3-phosphate cytidylyltransferase